jgi:hypothetical protein
MALWESHLNVHIIKIQYAVLRLKIKISETPLVNVPIRTSN